jgi:hypothetical protein
MVPTEFDVGREKDGHPKQLSITGSRRSKNKQEKQPSSSQVFSHLSFNF